MRDAFPAAGLTYPTTFARSLSVRQLPFMPEGTTRRFIERADSTLQEWLEPGEHWYAKEYRGARRLYTEAEMLALWTMVLAQKRVVEAWWRVVQGQFAAINPALEWLDAGMGEIPPSSALVSPRLQPESAPHARWGLVRVPSSRHDWGRA